MCCWAGREGCRSRQGLADHFMGMGWDWLEQSCFWSCNRKKLQQQEKLPSARHKGSASLPGNMGRGQGCRKEDER